MRLAVLLAGLALSGCSMLGGSGLSGRYMYAPGYGFEFKDGKVYSMAGSGSIGSGTYTVDGTSVRICISVMCNDLTLDDDCLVDDGYRYCKEG